MRTHPIITHNFVKPIPHSQIYIYIMYVCVCVHCKHVYRKIFFSINFSSSQINIKEILMEHIPTVMEDPDHMQGSQRNLINVRRNHVLQDDWQKYQGLHLFQAENCQLSLQMMLG